MFRRTYWSVMPGLLAFALAALGPAGARADLRDSVADGHAGLFQTETVEQANHLIQRMKEDTGKDLVIETFDKLELKFEQLPEEFQSQLLASNPSLPKESPGAMLLHMKTPLRKKYVELWARQRAEKENVDGVYALIFKGKIKTKLSEVELKLAAATIGPTLEPRLFPRDKQAWLAAKLEPPAWNRHYDETLLSVVVPGVWYTIQFNENNPAAATVTNHVWLPTLTIIGVMVGVWVIISLLRGLVALVARSRPAEPDLSRTRLGDTTVTAAPPGHTTSAGDDSVDY